MALIKFGANSKKHWFFLLGSLTLILRTYTFPKNTPSLNPYIKLFFMGSGMIPALLFNLFYYLNLPKYSHKLHKPLHSSIKSHLCNLLIYLLIAFLDSAGFIYSINVKRDHIHFHGTEHLQYLVQFLIAAILSYFFLNKRLLKHHKVFSLIMVFGLLFIILSNILSSTHEFHYHILLLLIDGVAYGIIMVIAKWLMDYKFVSAFAIVGYDGLFSALIATVFIFRGGFWSEMEYSVYFIANAIAFAILTLGYAMFIFLVVQHFGATHRVVMDLISAFVILVIDSLWGKKEMSMEEGVVLFMGHLIVLSGVVGYNEVLVCKCCGLEYDTEVEIVKRATDENIDESIGEMDSISETLE